MAYPKRLGIFSHHMDTLPTKTPCASPRPGTPGVAHVLVSPSYTGQRWAPQYGDPFYLILSDLRLALEAHGSDLPLKILDYGCGGSPYRPLFPKADYRRADHDANSHLDYQICLDAPLAADESSFDLILSTQVLEHTQDSQFYLHDCHRLLKRSATLILSTHGSFPDHGCPYDYQRWTPEGLTRDLSMAGFQVLSMKKLTAGPRATLFYLEQYAEAILAPKSTLFGFVIALLRRLIRERRPSFHRWADQYFQSSRIVECSGNDRTDVPFYVGLLAAAHKL